MKKTKRFKMHVKKGDTVQIIAGKYKNKIGEIIQILPQTSKVIIKNLNIKIKHIKPKQGEEKGKIINFEAPIHSSNVKLYSIKMKTSSRYKIIFDENQIKYRKLNKTGEIIK